MSSFIYQPSIKQGVQILSDVLPRECREAHAAGLLHIHNLERFFEPEDILIDLASSHKTSGARLQPLQMFRQLLRAASKAVGVCVPHFDEDVGTTFAQNLSGVKEVMREVFLALHEFYPETPFTLNVGAAFSGEGTVVTEAILDLLDEGPTLTQPFVIMRVRRGQNLSEGDPHHELLRRALDVARHRQGLAFALLDSTLNCQWLDGVAYTSSGLRVEPMTSDFLRGTRDHHIVGSVSIDLPLLVGEQDGELERVLKLAARVLAQRHELITSSYGGLLGPQVINLTGLSDCYPEDPLASFALLEKLSVWTAQLRSEYGLEYVLAATNEKRQSSFSIAAEQQYILKGGHCLICPAGSHLSIEELYADLQRAVHSGVSFLRYAVDDVRCLKCHATVAAMGACPACGCLERREVVYDDGRLVGGIRSEDYPEPASLN